MSITHPQPARKFGQAPPRSTSLGSWTNGTSQNVESMYFEDYYPDAISDTTTLSSSANSAVAEIDVTCDDANAWIVNLFDYIKSNENCSMQSAGEYAAWHRWIYTVLYS